MKTIYKMLGKWLLAYGEASAGAASFHGSYEAPVPAQLQNRKD